MSDKIRLSPKHGVNPTLLRCFACGEDAGVGLLGFLPHDAEAPRSMVRRDFFCVRCEKVVKGGGVLLVETRDGEKGNDPYRTGRLWGITGEAFDRMFEPQMPAGLLGPGNRPPVIYIEESAARKFGFPHDEPEEKKEVTPP